MWQAAWTPDGADNPAFVQKFGLSFGGVDISSPYAHITYQNVTLTRQWQNQDIGLIEILDPAKVEVLATAKTTDLSQETPYITRAANLWYVADNPLSYVTMTDRYLAFADVWHVFFGSDHHPESHRAMIRIEDVHPKADPQKLRAIADYLYSQQVPFMVCVIPEYKDPLGTYNGGVPLTVTLAEAPEVVNALRYMLNRGGQIGLHGLMHQYDSVANPYSGVSAEDYEFYRVILDQGNQTLVGPVSEDSPDWARNRVLEAKRRLTDLNLRAIAWNTPHYLASVTDYLEFVKVFSLSLDRGAYFATDSLGQEYCLNQMAPYVFQRDSYGIKRLPETIGYVNPSSTSPVADMLNRAQANLVVRDGWASGYFHWYLDLSYLQELIPGLKSQGYEFAKIGPGSVAPMLQLLLLD